MIVMQKKISGLLTVVIGRNEGERLKRCLLSVRPYTSTVVYVDSGSTDGSVDFAKSIGVHVVSLEAGHPFTAARARNLGWRAARQLEPGARFVQFVDGDCEVDSAWLTTAKDFLATHPETAVVCGRRRERYPQASIYNSLCNIEWDTPIGQATACGGDAMMRLAVLESVDGYNDELIAGEEPDLCLRMRKKSHLIHRIDAEMTLHDANIHHFKQWWRRAMRGGYAYAEGAWRYGQSPERHWVTEVRRITFWAIILPLLMLTLSTMLVNLGLSEYTPLTLIPWVMQGLRILLRTRHSISHPAFYAVFMVLIKFPEAWGLLTFHYKKTIKAKQQIIEYK
jgi:glycosyltransferase involved in cell wall biosynthesis